MPSGACVLEYRGKRGTVWRIKYRDADGRQVHEWARSVTLAVFGKAVSVVVARSGPPTPRSVDGRIAHGFPPRTAAPRDAVASG